MSPRLSRRTMVGLQPDTEIPFELDGRRSGLRMRKSTIRIVSGQLRYVPPRKPMSNADAQCVCAGVVCFVMAFLVWALS